MKMGLVGKKLGMTRVFDENGNVAAVTVVEVATNIVSQIKLQATDGYDAVQVVVRGNKKHITKSLVGHFAKANIDAGVVTKEFRLSAEEISGYSVGDVFDASLFSVGQRIDVRARSIGKGFSGTIKRHHFSGQRKTHGNSLSHRVPGSIGQNQTPGRVFKGKKMSGHLGNEMRSVQNLEIVRVDGKRGLLLVKGSIPGARGGYVEVRPSIKIRG